jgi:methylamine dehydrogenase accessory protein MauD
VVPSFAVSGWWAVSFVALWCAVIALGMLVVALAREVGALHLRLGPRGALEIDTEGPPLGAAVPGVRGVGLDGATGALGGPGSMRVILFASPTCTLCGDVLYALPSISRGDADGIVVGDAPPGHMGEWRTLGIPVISSPEAFTAYAVPGTPYAIVIDEMGRVLAKGTPNDPEQLEGLLLTARKRAGEVIRVP